VLTRQKATASETNGSVEHFARQKVQRLNAIVIGCDSEDSEGRNAQLTVIGYGVGRGVRADCAVSSTQRRSISNPIKRGRETEAQHSTYNPTWPSAGSAICNFRARLSQRGMWMCPWYWYWSCCSFPAGGGPTDKTKHPATGAESRTLIVSQTQFHGFHRLCTVLCTMPRLVMLSGLCSLLPLLSYAPWRSALVSSGAEAGHCEPAISQCTPLSALGQCSGSPAAKNTHTPNRVEKEILRDPGLGLGRYCFEGYNANEVTAILALPAWHAPHSHSPIRCSRCRLHIISRLPLRRGRVVPGVLISA
jgi:hypothetical protein